MSLEHHKLKLPYFLAGPGLAGLLLISGCSPYFLPDFRTNGICSPNVNESLQKFDLDKLMQGESVLLTPLNTDRALLSQHIRTVTFSKNGFWLGYGNPMPDTVGFFYLGKNTAVEACGPIGEKDHIRGNVNAIAEHPKLGLVVATDRWQPTDRFGVWILEKGSNRWTQHLPENKLNGDQSYTILIEDGAVLVGTWEGVRRFDGKRWYDEDYLMPEGKRLPVHALAKTEKEYWVGLLHGGVFRVNSDNPAKNFLYTRENTPWLTSNEIRDIEVAPDGKIWVLGDPGVARFDPVTNEWTREDLPIKAMKVRFIDGVPYIATGKGVLYKEGNKWQTYSPIPALDIDSGEIGGKRFLAAATNQGLLLSVISK